MKFLHQIASFSLIYSPTFGLQVLQLLQLTLRKTFCGFMQSGATKLAFQFIYSTSVKWHSLDTRTLISLYKYKEGQVSSKRIDLKNYDPIKIKHKRSVCKYATARQAHKASPTLYTQKLYAALFLSCRLSVWVMSCHSISLTLLFQDVAVPAH